MKKPTSSEFRQMYLDFFKEYGHMVLPSQSLIPQDGPTLLWISSGVTAMKKYFDGSVIPKNRRITSSQKSIRTNGIENVGKTAHHQTFFEMFGNFSVDDYFRDEAISWAWESLIDPKWLGLDKDKLFCTVYPKDVDSQRVWERAGMPKDHIIKLEDNSRNIGEGPCGPDTEIFYDRGQKNNGVVEDDPENFPGGENVRYLEIWNIVFSQYNHLPNGEYADQPHKNIDTGMGLERVFSTLQDVPTNFETDLFLPMTHETEKMSAGKKYGTNKEGDIALKIITDHVRVVSFIIGDGALPSNSGRGYVLRRLIGRVDLNSKRLGINGVFLYKLAPVVGKIMESHCPEALKQASFVQKIVKNGEDRFGATLESGLSLLGDLIERVSASDGKTISGKDAFKLFSTYGFPYELTFEAAQDRGLKVDKASFDKEMDTQKERTRKARGDPQSMGRQDETLMNIKDKSEFKYGVYEKKHAKLIDIVVDDKLVDKADGGTATLILGETPFYAERGGQVADHGDIYDQDGDLVAKVTNVQHAPNDQNLHFIDLVLPMERGKEYVLKIDAHRREGLRHSHTATRLIHAALRGVLGEHTHQAGSLVDPDFLRFDFTTIDPMTPREIEAVERLVNQKIWENIDVKTTITDPEAGRKIGVLALFNGKYGDKVRVVQINDFSTGFCGGTHCSNIAQIGIFKVISEQAIGVGMRRIEAVTNEKAYEYLTNRDTLLEEIKQEVKATRVEDAETKITSLEEKLHASQKKAAELESEINAAKVSDIFENVQEANGLKVIAAMADVNGMNDLRELADNWKASNKSDVLVLACANDGKANMVISLADAALDKGLKASNLIKVAVPVFGGDGGGRPNMAQAGGKNPAGPKETITAAINEINK